MDNGPDVAFIIIVMSRLILKIVPISRSCELESPFAFLLVVSHSNDKVWFKQELQNHCIIFDIGGCDKQAAFYNPEFASYQQIRKMYADVTFVLER